jgi:ribosome-associated translation inhibitor RaiA
VTRNANLDAAGVHVIEGAVVDANVPIEVHGVVSSDEQAYAREKVAHLLRYAPSPARVGRVRLRREPNPAFERPASAEASIELDGHAVRAHAERATMREAIDALESRLRHRLERTERRGRSLRFRHRDRTPGEWRHGDPASHHPQYYERPPDEREVVRRKAFMLEPETPDEALDGLELLDHDFYLFRDAELDTECVLHRSRSGAHRLIQPAGPGRRRELPSDIEPSRRVPAQLDLAGARALLDLTDEPFLFFVDERSGRGNVLYRRRDGHYGLIAPGLAASA